MTRLELARAGERAASTFLEARGWVVLESNYRCPPAEIDLIARDGTVLVFVEVKTRQSPRAVPAEAVSPQKQRKIRLAAAWYLKERRLADPPCRFDVIAVTGRNESDFTLEHFPGAF